MTANPCDLAAGNRVVRAGVLPGVEPARQFGFQAGRAITEMAFHSEFTPVVRRLGCLRGCPP